MSTGRHAAPRRNAGWQFSEVSTDYRSVSQDVARASGLPYGSSRPSNHGATGPKGRAQFWEVSGNAGYSFHPQHQCWSRHGRSGRRPQTPIGREGTANSTLHTKARVGGLGIAALRADHAHCVRQGRVVRSAHPPDGPQSWAGRDFMYWVNAVIWSSVRIRRKGGMASVLPSRIRSWTCFSVIRVPASLGPLPGFMP
jgi:hypothetical protein